MSNQHPFEISNIDEKVLSEIKESYILIDSKLNIFKHKFLLALNKCFESQENSFKILNDRYLKMKLGSIISNLSVSIVENLDSSYNETIEKMQVWLDLPKSYFDSLNKNFDGRVQRSVEDTLMVSTLGNAPKDMAEFQNWNFSDFRNSMLSGDGSHFGKKSEVQLDLNLRNSSEGKIKSNYIKNSEKEKGNSASRNIKPVEVQVNGKNKELEDNRPDLEESEPDGKVYPENTINSDDNEQSDLESEKDEINLKKKIQKHKVSKFVKKI